MLLLLLLLFVWQPSDDDDNDNDDIGNSGDGNSILFSSSHSFLHIKSHRHIPTAGRNIFTYFCATKQNEGKHVKHLALDNKLWHIIIKEEEEAFLCKPFLSLARTAERKRYAWLHYGSRKFPSFHFHIFCSFRFAHAIFFALPFLHTIYK